MELCYETPAGYIDYPFVYVFDATALVDGQSPRDLSIQIRGDADFLLRRLAGVPLVAQSIQFRNASRSQVFGALARLPNNYTVLPEKLYPASSEITFDLGVVARAFIACGADPIFRSFLAFQGVRRLRNPTGREPNYTAYRYYERPFVYQLTLTVDWRRYTVAPILEAPRRFAIPVDNYDFELHAISVARTTGAQLATTDFQILLYDEGQNALSTVALNIDFVNLRGPAGFDSVFPVPPIMYHKGSQIAFDIVSFICNLDADFPKVYDVEFRGIERVPC